METIALTTVAVATDRIHIYRCKLQLANRMQEQELILTWHLASCSTGSTDVTATTTISITTNADPPASSFTSSSGTILTRLRDLLSLLNGRVRDMVCYSQNAACILFLSCCSHAAVPDHSQMCLYHDVTTKHFSTILPTNCRHNAV